MADLLEFDRNGRHYTAGKGFAFATKEGRRVWNALDVFSNHFPSEEDVLWLEGLMDFDFSEVEKGGNEK